MNPKQTQMYAAEAEDNFRWLFKIASTQSPFKLSLTNQIPPSTLNTISNIGQFAEIAHGSLSPSPIFASLDTLSQPGFPLESYPFLRGARFLQSFKGNVADLKGYTALKENEPGSTSLILAFSGTSSALQAVQDIKVWFKKYPSQTGATVHAGFWDLYQGIREPALDALKTGTKIDQVTEMIFTAHSMGSVMAYLLLLELMEEEESVLKGKKIKLVVFGCPRAGNEALVGLWRSVVDRWNVDGSFEEFSVRAYNDGVPSVPPRWLGYAHFASSPLYLYHEKLYQIPSSEAEHTNFTVLLPPDSDAPEFPLGGHNYYNSRDMELLQRSLRNWDFGEGS